MNPVIDVPLLETANSILNVLLQHCGDWVTEATLLNELRAKRTSFYHKTALEHLALTRRIHIRAVSSPTEFHYEYKYR